MVGIENGSIRRWAKLAGVAKQMVACFFLKSAHVGTIPLEDKKMVNWLVYQVLPAQGLWGVVQKPPTLWTPKLAAPSWQCRCSQCGCHSQFPGWKQCKSGHSFILLTRPGPVWLVCFFLSCSSYRRCSSKALKMLQLTFRMLFSPYSCQCGQVSCTGGFRGWPSAWMLREDSS